MDVPFVYSSNGDAFLERDLTALRADGVPSGAVPTGGGVAERELPLSAFPSPQDLWMRWKEHAAVSSDQEKIVPQDYYIDGSGKAPRYYQLTAINRTLAAVSRGKRRLLLVMATGTGKTFTAFQIIYRLWNPRRRYIVDGVTVDVSHERVQYLDEHGKLITESLRDYARNRQYEKPPAVALSWIRGGDLIPHTTHRRRIWKA